MLQRIQTVFMLILVIAMTLVFFADIWHRENPETGAVGHMNGYSLTVTNGSGEVEDELPTIWIVMVAGLSASIAIYSITRYNNRMLQIRLNFFNTLFIIGTLGLMYVFARQGEGMIGGGDGGPFKWGMFLPAVALVMNSLANRFIMRDERMVREADRIR